MQPVTVADVADELYALSPAEFTAARDERARQVRAAGQRDEAAAIKKLARPTASAAVANCRHQYTSACYTPQQLRVAYDIQPLLDRGTDGRGQTVVLMLGAAYAAVPFYNWTSSAGSTIGDSTRPNLRGSR